MYKTYRRVMRSQRRGTHGTDAKTWMLLLALVAMAGSAVYWWGVQSQLTESKVVALAFTAILVLAPPILVSFLIPWSPGGMLLQKVNARTWGFLAVVGCSIYLVYYSIQLQVSWWSAQPVVADSNLVYQQVFIGIIGFIIIPALLWTPVSDEELQERVKQAHLVQRYRMQTAADIAILDATLLRAQQKAIIGFANLADDEQEELAAVMEGLVTGIDRTLQQIAGNMNMAAETVYGEQGRDMFGAPPLADDLSEILRYVGEAIGGSRMQLAAPPPAQAADNAKVPPRVQAPSAAIAATAEASPPPLPPRQSAAERGRAPQYAAEYMAMLRKLPLPFRSADLATALGKSDRTAREIIKAWCAQGLARPSDDLKNAYYLTEDEEVS